MRFIGDIHGNFNEYLAVIDGQKNSIQVGDFGVGFGIDPPVVGEGHKFIRGNHDDLKICRTLPGWINDGEVEETRFGPMMLIGGAWSIDWEYRTAGHDWWYDEELNDYEFEALFEKYKEVKPSIMITHDLPFDIKNQIVINKFNGIGKTRTGHWLQEMFNVHQPDLWICGHHHQNIREEIEGTIFIVLGINAYIDIELEK